MPVSAIMKVTQKNDSQSAYANAAQCQPPSIRITPSAAPEKMMMKNQAGTPTAKDTHRYCRPRRKLACLKS